MKSLITLFLALLLAGCANQSSGQHSRTSAAGAPTTPRLTIAQQAEYARTSVLADLAASRKQYAVAIHNYLLAARLSQQPEMVRKAVLLAERTKDFISSLQGAELWLKIEPNNPTAVAMAAVGYLRSNRQEKLRQTLSRLVEVTGTLKRGVLLDLLGQIDRRTEDSDFPAELTRLGLIYPKRPDIPLAQARHLDEQHLTLQALAEAQKALNLAPNYAIAIEIKGLLLIQAGQIKTATQFLKKSITRHPGARTLKLHLAQIYYQKKQYAKAEHLTRMLMHSKQTTPSQRYLQGAVLFAEKKYDASELEFLKLLNDNFRFSTVNFFLGEINRLQKRSHAAIEFYDSVGSGDYLVRARRSSALLLASDNQLTAGLFRLRNYRGSDVVTQILLGDTEISLLNKYSRVGEFQDSILKAFSMAPARPFNLIRVLQLPKSPITPAKALAKALHNASAKTERDIIRVALDVFGDTPKYSLLLPIMNRYLKAHPRDTELLYSRAMLVAEHGNLKLMEIDLRRILAIKPNHTDALNALGYSLADQGRDLTEAYRMIMQAYKQRPNSAAVTDSVGWIFYHRGQLQKSAKFLARAWDLEPSPEIGAHYGEVLWVIGEQAKANSIWTAALKLDTSNKTLLATIKRLKK